ncbi:MAG: hypothetical protein M1292_07075 [Bacteroidetes bacterium]|nr:hypothetical protein [Bacteroidota bacterium]
MKINDKYLEAAQVVLATNAGGLIENGKVPSVYNGYVSAFGGSMVQPGLYATVISYYTDAKKAKIADLIFEIYKIENSTTAGQISQFLEFIEPNRRNRQVRNNIAQSVIALKLVLRTFNFDNENEE